MPKKYTFSAALQKSSTGGALVRIPFDVEKEFGAKRAKVKAYFDGELYRGWLVRYGTDYHILGVPREIRLRLGKEFGDEVTVSVEEDLEPHLVEVPPELAQAFKKAKAAEAFFKSLPYSHQREYVGYITEAKKAETRAKRVVQTIDKLKKKAK